MTNLDQQIYDTAIAAGFTPVSAKFVVAQARFESADYTSNVFKNNNNTSGIKYVSQANATQGTLSPEGNYYAHFNTITDAINDKINRIYKLTMGGVTSEELKNSKTAEEFATLLQKRGYYTTDLSNYISGIKSKLLKINIIEFVQKNKFTLGIGLILIGVGAYFYVKLKNK